jgi:hypothetical protein
MSTQSMGVIGKIGWRSAKLRASWQQIPENLADADNFESHT